MLEKLWVLQNFPSNLHLKGIFENTEIETDLGKREVLIIFLITWAITLRFEYKICQIKNLLCYTNNFPWMVRDPLHSSLSQKLYMAKMF